MYSLPQEIEVWYVIPAIRRELSKIFTKKHGLTQEESAKILGVSKAAVSQYMHSKRATSLKFTPEIRKEIENSAERILKDRSVVIAEIMGIISTMKSKKALCSVCKKYNKGIIKICSMEPVME